MVVVLAIWLTCLSRCTPRTPVSSTVTSRSFIATKMVKRCHILTFKPMVAIATCQYPPLNPLALDPYELTHKAWGTLGSPAETIWYSRHISTGSVVSAVPCAIFTRGPVLENGDLGFNDWKINRAASEEDFVRFVEIELWWHSSGQYKIYSAFTFLFQSLAQQQNERTRLK